MLFTLVTNLPYAAFLTASVFTASLSLLKSTGTDTCIMNTEQTRKFFLHISNLSVSVLN